MARTAPIAKVALLLYLAPLACKSGAENAPPPPDAAPHACMRFDAAAPPTPASTHCALTIGGAGSSARVFAIGNKQDIVAHATYAQYCESFDRTMREVVAPCLAKDRPNVVVFPEDATLAAAFIGQRGEKARKKTDSDAAFLNLAGSYSKAIVHYQQRFPGLPAGRQLTLALTDVDWRVLHDVFGAISKQYGVYVAVSGNVAGARETTDDVAVAALRDPEVLDGPVYEAVDDQVYNSSIVFGPDGALVSVQKKAYLVPAEEESSPSGDATLALAYGALPQLAPIALPFGRVSAAISKDAWMPLVRDRFEAWGTEVVLQHEAFSGWTIEELPGDWLPDVFAEGGYGLTARAGSVRYVVAPMLTGNLFSLVFDGQSHVTKRAAAEDVAMGFVGDPKVRGFAAIAPWAAPASIGDTRDALRAYGQSLLPGGARENAYVEGVAAADLELHADGRYPKLAGVAAPGALGASRAIAASEAAQRHVALASAGPVLAAAWEEGPLGGGSILALMPLLPSSAPVRVASGVARLPSIAVDATGRVAVAWEEERAGDGGRVYLSISSDGGKTFPPAAAPFDDGKSAQWMPTVVADPKSPRFYVAWSDLRDGGRSHVYVAAEGQRGTRVDPAHVDPTTRGDEWRPRLVADDASVHVVWLDFRDFSWDVRYARSIDGAKTFSPATRVNDATPSAGAPPKELERLESDATIALDAASKPIVAWTSLQERQPLPWASFDRAPAGAFGADALLSDARSCAAEVPAGWCAAFKVIEPEIALSPAGPIFSATGSDAVVLVRPSSTGAPRVERVSDAPSGGHAVRARIATLADGSIAVAWEDDRDGVTQVRIAIGK